MPRTIGLDAEFYNSNEKNMDVVCFVANDENGSLKFDTTTELGKKSFKQYMDSLKNQDVTLVAYAAIAECRALMSLGINPLQYRWVDLYVEFIMLCNSNSRFTFGRYLDSDSNPRFSIPLDPNLTEQEREADNQDHTEAPKNLLNALYKVLDIKEMDHEEKNNMRDIILSKDIDLINKHMEDILDYCEKDTKYLRALDVGISIELEKEGIYDFRTAQYARGRYSACTARAERTGMPIHLDLLQRIIQKTPEILQIHKDAVNEYFPFFLAGHQKPDRQFKNGSVFRYKYTKPKKDMRAYQAYVESLQIANFPKTAGGKYKLDGDTLEEFGYWKGLEALWKYNKTETSLKWFNKDNKNGFFDRVGGDTCVRPYYGIFGTQTGRNAAKAKTFPLAMSSWLRSIVRPNFNSCIIGADFSQQEVYVAAILSGDENLFNAYTSGDVYLAFAKQAGLVPTDATKHTYKHERNLCKGTVLGLQFGMGKDKLRTKLTLDSGNPVSVEKTEELIKAHKTVFKQYWDWVYSISRDYKKGEPLITSDGWVLFCDNPVVTSTRNFLVQATAASITRKAFVLATEEGLDVMCSLHDAIYIKTQENLQDYYLLKKCMLKATEEILKEKKTKMRIDFKQIDSDEPWVEEKGQKDWDKLKGFLR